METILCPTDFSPASENAIRYADQLARWLHARVILFHNIAETVTTGTRSFGGVLYAEPIRDPEHRQQQLDRLNACKNELAGTAGSSPILYESKIRYGSTQDNIAEEAFLTQADVIVLGGKRTEGLKQLFTGSVVGDVIRQAPCPVLIVPDRASFQPFTKIVFATSLTDMEATDIDFIAKLAAHFRAKVFFLHILTEESTSERQQAEAAFEQFRQRLLRINTALSIETHDNIEEGINQFTGHFQADLLVMGYHPHSLLETLFLSDRTQKMASHSTLPLLVIHHQKHQPLPMNAAAPPQ